MNGARLRTLIVAAGLGFAGAALGGACLDYAGEDWGACSAIVAPKGSTGAGSGVGSARLGAGSGVGTGAPATVSAADCGTVSPSDDGGDAGAARP
jgi:hypothetical protein